MHKIKWDSRERAEEYVLYYYDRMEKKLKGIRYADITRIEDGFLAVYINGRETNLPLHRIRKVEKKGKVTWERVYGAR